MMETPETAVDQAALNRELAARLDRAQAVFNEALAAARVAFDRELELAVEAFRAAGGVFNTTTS